MKKIINSSVIMAAGRGVRLIPLTDTLPKAMMPFNGNTLIGLGIEKVRKHLPNVYVTVGYKGPMLANHVIERNVTGLFNTDGQDNAWWIFNTLLKHLDEPIFVLTCDNVTELDFPALTEEYFSFNCPACMVVPVKPIEGLDGDYITHENNKIKKLSRNEPTSIYCSGIQILNPSKINQLIEPVDNFYLVWQQLIDIEQLYCSHTYPSKWFVVDTLEQFNNLNNITA